MIKQASESLKITRQCLYNWIEVDEELQNAQREAKESTYDFAEGKLLTNIKDGKETSLIFFLKTQCKKRGYVEKSELNVTGSIVLKVDEEDLKV